MRYPSPNPGAGMGGGDFLMAPAIPPLHCIRLTLEIPKLFVVLQQTTFSLTYCSQGVFTILSIWSILPENAFHPQVLAQEPIFLLNLPLFLQAD